MTLVAGSLAAPGVAQAALTIDTTVSATEVRSGETATFTVTAGNTGPSTHPNMEIGLLALRAEGEKSVPDNTYLSVSSPQGPCTIDTPGAPPFDYTGANCMVGDVPAGGTAQVFATVRISESMDQLASILGNTGGGPFIGRTSPTVWAIYPPRFLVSSSKLKLKGLPDGCVERDFRVTATSKGAKKITASLAGPYDEWHNRLDGSGFSGKIGAAKGSKLELDVPIGGERAGFYDLKLAAKSENGPKQKTEVDIQRCGVPEGL